MLPFIPELKQILYCDFSDGNPHQPPEMRKTRAVVVISKRKHNRDLVTVLPFSTSPPTSKSSAKQVYFIKKHTYDTIHSDSWIKCSCIASVARSRLKGVKKKSSFINVFMSDKDYENICNVLRYTLNLPKNT